jgi:hypothetical protein
MSHAPCGEGCQHNCCNGLGLNANLYADPWLAQRKWKSAFFENGFFLPNITGTILPNITGTIDLNFGVPCSCSKLTLELWWCIALDKITYAFKTFLYTQFVWVPTSVWLPTDRFAYSLELKRALRLKQE